MESIEVVIIGGGPSAILAADKLLGAKPFNASVQVLERKRRLGGIPADYSTVPPNSPFQDLYAFLMDLRAERLFSEQYEARAAEILRSAQESPSLGRLDSALDLIVDDLLGPDPNFEVEYGVEVKEVTQRRDGKYVVRGSSEGWRESWEADVVISAVGGVPRKNPYKASFRREVPLTDALERGSNIFRGERVVIAGSSHSAAIAFINAVQQGAKAIEVWHKGDEPFLEHRIEGQIKHYQFSGINDPTLSALHEARRRFEGRYSFRNVDRDFSPGAQYRDWLVVPAIGFERPKIMFTSSGGGRGPLERITQGDEFGSTPPNLCFPGTDNPIPLVYGLGLAYPLKFREGFLPNTVERQGAGIVGIYFTNELSKLIIPDIVNHLYAKEDPHEH